MKKILITLLASLVLLCSIGLIACGGGDNSVKTYTITYDVNGGNELESTTQTVTYGEEFTLVTPTDESFIFGGWFYGDQLIESGNSWSIQKNVTLVAKWTSDPSLFTVSSTKPHMITGLVDEAKNVETIIIPETINDVTITTIADKSFKDNTSLKSVTFLSNITLLGQYIFEGCTSLISVDFSKCKAPYINAYTFQNCTALEKVILSDTFEIIYSYAFNGCNSLTEIDIPDNVQRITSYGFYSCPKLTRVGLTENSKLTEIGYQAFYKCESLVRFFLPDTVTSIKGYAFEGCKSLVYIDISDNSQLEEIANYAFYNCYSLTNFTFPKNLTSLSKSAICNCSQLTEIRDLSTEQWTLKSDFNSHTASYFVRNTYTLDSGEQKLFIDNNGYVTFDGELVGYAGNEVNLVLPTGITSIGYHAFYNRANIKSIVISNTVTEIKDQAIVEMPNLISMTVPSSVKICPSGAILGCPRFFEVFWYADSRLLNGLYNATGKNDNKNKLPPIRHFTEGEQSELVYTGDFITYSYTISVSTGGEETRNIILLYTGTDKNILIPEGITHIYDSAFRDNTYIESVVFSDTVDYIGTAAFANCTNLSSVTLSDINSYEGFGNSAFAGCTSLKSITIPDTVRVISNSCFARTGLESIDLNNVSIINKYAFENCKALEIVYCSSSLSIIKDYAFKDSSVTTIDYDGTVSDWQTKVYPSCEAYWYYNAKFDIVCNNGNAPVR